MGMFTKGNGPMIKPMDMVYTRTWTELAMRVIGKRISNMAKGKRLGQTEQCTREIIFLEKNKDSEFLHGLMAQSTTDSSTTTISKEKGNIVGLMVGLSQVCGKETKCME